jgi:hypothetical protein
VRSTPTAARLFATLATSALLAGVVTAGPSLTPAPTPDETRRLAAGEVLVRLEEIAAAGPREGVARGVIDAPPERVAAVLADFAHYREWMPFVERSDARREADGTVVSAQSLHLPALVGDRSYRIRAVSAVAEGKDGRLWSTRWTYVPGSGNVVDTHGSWTVTGFGGVGARRSLAICHLFTDPGGRVPHWAVDRATGESLPWIFQGLRQQVRRERYLKD